MIGVISDQRIFSELLHVHNPKVYEHLTLTDFDFITVITIQWFVCLYTFGFNKRIT